MEPISKEEADEMRYVLATRYGGQTATWKINAEVYELFGQLVEKSGTCTDAVDLLPRPYSGPPTLKWAMKQVRQGLIRYFKSQRGQHYLMCMRAAAMGFKTDIQLAAVHGK